MADKPKLITKRAEWAGAFKRAADSGRAASQFEAPMVVRYGKTPTLFGAGCHAPRGAVAVRAKHRTLQGYNDRPVARQGAKSGKTITLTRWNSQKG